jgi:hypothetical protein
VLPISKVRLENGWNEDYCLPMLIFWFVTPRELVDLKSVSTCSTKDEVGCSTETLVEVHAAL